MLEINFQGMTLKYDDNGLVGDEMLKNIAKYYILNYGPEKGDPYKWLAIQLKDFFPDAEIVSEYMKPTANNIF